MKILGAFFIQLGIMCVVALGFLSYFSDTMAQWNEPFRVFCFATSTVTCTVSFIAGFVVLTEW